MLDMSSRFEQISHLQEWSHCCCVTKSSVTAVPAAWGDLASPDEWAGQSSAELHCPGWFNINLMLADLDI